MNSETLLTLVTKAIVLCTLAFFGASMAPALGALVGWGLAAFAAGLVVWAWGRGPFLSLR